MSRYRISLPGCIALLFLVSGLSAEDPRVLILSSPEEPAAGEYWTLTLRIEHPLPDEVTVMAPPFTGSIFLDKTLKSGRFTADGETEEHWTEVEYRFLLHEPGLLEFEPFTVIIPGGQTETEPIVIEVGEEVIPDAVQRYFLNWAGPSKMQTGETASFSLKLSGWDSRHPFPPSGVFMPPLVKGAIIEEGKRSDEDLKAALVLRLKLIPLGPASLVFPERTIVYDNNTLTIPGFSIAVSPSPAQVHSADIAGADENAPENNIAPAPFPEFETASGFFGAAYENVYHSAENIWNQGYYAEALTLLRRNERDHFSPLFLTLRRQAEQNLGLYHTGDETPRTFFFNLSVFCFFLVLTAALFYFVRKGRGKKWLTAFAVFLLLTLTPMLYFGVPVRAYRPAVLKQTGVWLIPDSSGEPAAYFQEGQPVKISGNKGLVYQQVSWVWIQANDQSGLAGWVPEDRVVYY